MMRHTWVVMPPQPVTDMFDYLFAELPPSIETQRKSFEEKDDG